MSSSVWNPARGAAVGSPIVESEVQPSAMPIIGRRFSMAPQCDRTKG